MHNYTNFKILHISVSH